jgi:hypothetical protein
MSSGIALHHISHSSRHCSQPARITSALAWTDPSSRGAPPDEIRRRMVHGDAPLTTVLADSVAAGAARRSRHRD